MFCEKREEEKKKRRMCGCDMGERETQSSPCVTVDNGQTREHTLSIYTHSFGPPQRNKTAKSLSHFATLSLSLSLSLVIIADSSSTFLLPFHAPPRSTTHVTARQGFSSASSPLLSGTSSSPLLSGTSSSPLLSGTSSSPLRNLLLSSQEPPPLLSGTSSSPLRNLLLSSQEPPPPPPLSLPLF